MVTAQRVRCFQLARTSGRSGGGPNKYDRSALKGLEPLWPILLGFQWDLARTVQGSNPTPARPQCPLMKSTRQRRT